ncbi:MAG: alpha/beta hydrolase [Coprobacillus sp.]
MRKFIVNNQDLEIHGMIKGKEDSNHVFITLHGGPGGNMLDMANVKTCKILEDNYLCVYFDQRGCGESIYDLRQGLEKITLIEDVKKVIEYIKQQYPDSVIHLLGFSFGGYLGFLTTSIYPNIVHDYIVCNPAITFSRDEALAMFERVQGGYDKRFPELKKTQEIPEVIMQSAAFTDFVFSEHNTANSLRYMHAMAPWFFKTYFIDIFKQISIPTLIFQGKEDQICHEKNLSKAISETKNELIQYYALDNCTHDIDEINTKIIIENINKFIKGGI